MRAYIRFQKNMFYQNPRIQYVKGSTIHAMIYLERMTHGTTSILPVIKLSDGCMEEINTLDIQWNLSNFDTQKCYD